VKICDMPTQERPQYRAEHYGMGALSTAELLQVICRNHDFDSNQMLVKSAGDLANLMRMSLQEKAATPGLGKKGALAIEAAFELGRRSMLEMPPDRVVIRSPADLAQMLMGQYSHEQQEHFIVILLDSRNKIIDTIDLYTGSLNAGHIRVGEVFQAAITKFAAAIIVAHNHPSGDPTPSPEDVHVTRQIVAAGDLLGVDVLDHLVIGQQRFISLRERGLGFDK